MKIYKYTIITLMLFLFGISNTYASCTQEEINNFKKVADAYTVKYEFDKASKKYKLTFSTPYPEKYAYSLDKNMEEKKYISSTDESLVFGNISSGEYKIEVIGVTKECDDSLKTITLKLPKYNKLSEDPKCIGIEEFVLCSPTYEKEIDYESFVSRIETYKKSKIKQDLEQKEPNTKTENEVLNRITKYIKDNLVQIIIVIVFIILVVITIVITAKSIRKSRRLD